MRRQVTGLMPCTDTVDSSARNDAVALPRTTSLMNATWGMALRASTSRSVSGSLDEAATPPPPGMPPPRNSPKVRLAREKPGLTLMMSAPRPLRRWLTLAWAPSPMEMMATTAATPMMMPRRVSHERSLRWRRLFTARFTESWNFMPSLACSLALFQVEVVGTAHPDEYDQCRQPGKAALPGLAHGLPAFRGGLPQALGQEVHGFLDGLPFPRGIGVGYLDLEVGKLGFPCRRQGIGLHEAALPGLPTRFRCPTGRLDAKRGNREVAAAEVAEHGRVKALRRKMRLLGDAHHDAFRVVGADVRNRQGDLVVAGFLEAHVEVRRSPDHEPDFGSKRVGGSRFVIVRDVRVEGVHARRDVGVNGHQERDPGPLACSQGGDVAPVVRADGQDEAVGLGPGQVDVGQDVVAGVGQGELHVHLPTRQQNHGLDLQFQVFPRLVDGDGDGLDVFHYFLFHVFRDRKS